MSITILNGDCRDVLKTLPEKSVQCCVTSPPYFGLRDYGHDSQIGAEPTPDEFAAELVAVFRDVRRVLKDDGTLWLNLGDSYSGAGHGGGGSFEKERNWRVGNPDKNNGSSNRDGLGRVSGIKPKDLIGIPWRVAFALQADGWYLRQDIIWAKPNPMPESVTDRCTKAHEYIFMLTKQAKYYYDQDAIKEPMSMSSVARLLQPGLDDQAGYARVPGKTNGNMKAVGKIDKQRGHGRRHDGFNARWDAMEKQEQCSGMRNKRSVWTVATRPFKESHYATFPPSLIEPCILAGCPVGGMVLDPFGGAGTTGLVADRLQRNATLIELNSAYATMARNRIDGDAPLFAEVTA